MKGILADANCEGHLEFMVRLMNEESRRGFWAHLNLLTPTFAELGLSRESSDSVVWETCQREQLVLLTVNRNRDGPESLQSTIVTRGTADSLPVFTIASGARFLRERSYAEQAADKFLQDLFDIEQYRGTGRV